MAHRARLRVKPRQAREAVEESVDGDPAQESTRRAQNSKARPVVHELLPTWSALACPMPLRESQYPSR